MPALRQEQVRLITVPSSSQGVPLEMDPRAWQAGAIPWANGMVEDTHNKFSDSDLEESNERDAFVPLLCDEVQLDDNGASIVFVLPRAQLGPDGWVTASNSGETIKLDDEKLEPFESACRIFRGESVEKVEQALGSLKEGPITQQSFIEAVRARLVQEMQSYGLRAYSFPSVDGDEVLLKVSLDRQGDVIRQLAAGCQYKVRVKNEAYMAAKSQGEDYKGGKPMCNSDGEDVAAYLCYGSLLEQYLTPFQHIDEIRLLHQRLVTWASISELQQQGVILRCFAGACHADVMRLNEKWANPRRLLCLPTFKEKDLVRDYFGERVAFFFFWFAFYARHMVPVAAAALVCMVPSMLNLKWLKAVLGHGSLWLKRALNLVFAVILVLWASLFTKNFARSSSRLQQQWGMEDWDNEGTILDTYDEKLEGTKKVGRNRLLTKLVVIAYCVLFASAIYAIEKCAERCNDGDGCIMSGLLQYHAVVQSMMIKIGSFLWGKVAYSLVARENRRTQERLDDSLAWTLASVKMFVALWPFVNEAFLAEQVNKTCSKSLAQAAFEVYQDEHWPKGSSLSSLPVTNSTPEALLMTFLRTFTYNITMSNGSELVCISGCYPTECESHKDRLLCNTNCVETLEHELLVFFIFDVVLHLVMDLLVPILLTKWEVVKELRAVKKGGGSTNYTFLQFQAKCALLGPYEYDSWGGSYTQDFLQLAITFTLIAAFSQVQQWMLVLGLISLSVEYHIVAYRMTNVTCRPWPAGASGIGVWAHIIDSASTLAVTCNVALAVFLMEPLRSLRFRERLIIFIVAEKALLTLKSLVQGLWQDQPDDVRRIADFNRTFERRLELKAEELRPAKVWDYSAVDVTLGVNAHVRGSRSSSENGSEEDE